MKVFPKNYDINIVEKKWQDSWEDSGIYKWDPSFPREKTFVIDTPPPTVSGLLHMGHVFSYTQTDIIARYQRMKGKTVFYPMGFDDNGLPTERLVEKERNVKGYNMERSEFIAICKEVVKEAEKEFKTLFKGVALSIDWDQEYQTISDRSKTLSQLSFLDLLSKKEAYRKNEPVLWDPVDVTALSQADIEDKEIKSHMNYIKFGLVEGGEITIATSRPEMIPACICLFVNENDPRYKKLIGKFAITPLFGIKVKILADEAVDIEKGTGAVMCCTFGDITDVYWWKKYKLDTKIILDKTGRILPLNASCDIAKNIEGCKVVEARTKIIELLKQNELLERQEEIIHIVKCGERSKAPIEILITPQWFIKVLDKKEELLEKSSQCVWYPSYMKARLDMWINGLNFDWCISRQRFFGVPFPIWYSKRKGEEGKVLTPPLESLPIDPLTFLPEGYTREEIDPDMDVMDTWATSSISPQLNSHAITKDFAIDFDRHQKLYPADLRPQAHEIIRTWTFSTIAKSLLHENTIPWKNLMISGWCLASDKTKMSKSKGNIVTPIHLIEEKGADNIRYWAATSKLGSDIAYSDDVFTNGKRLINKLWNASSFAAIHFANLEGSPSNVKEDIQNRKIFEKMDLWILDKLEQTIEKATHEFDEYEYSFARMATENLFWKDLCDNYLEIVKTRIYDEKGENPLGKQSGIYTLYHVLRTILKLFAPIMPHITEEIYNLLFCEDSIHKTGTWPKIEDFDIGSKLDESGEICVNILDEIRKIKAEKQISIKAPIHKIFIALEGYDKKILMPILSDLANVTNTEEIIFTDKKNDFIKLENEKTFIKVEF